MYSPASVPLRLSATFTVMGAGGVVAAPAGWALVGAEASAGAAGAAVGGRAGAQAASPSASAAGRIDRARVNAMGLSLEPVVAKAWRSQAFATTLLVFWLAGGAIVGARPPFGLELVPALVGQLVAEDVVDVDAVDVEPALLGALARRQYRALALLLAARVLLDDVVGAAAMLGVGLDVDRKVGDLLVGAAVVRLQRRHDVAVERRRLRLHADLLAGDGLDERALAGEDPRPIEHGLGRGERLRALDGLGVEPHRRAEAQQDLDVWLLGVHLLGEALPVHLPHVLVGDVDQVDARQPDDILGVVVVLLHPARDGLAGQLALAPELVVGVVAAVAALDRRA